MEPASNTPRRPVVFALGTTVGWLVLLTVFTGLSSAALGTRFDAPAALTSGRLLVAACLVLWLWRLGWLRSSGVARIGAASPWLLALATMFYMSAASLYSFFGSPALDASALALPAGRAVVLSALAAGLCEELAFRGPVLHALARRWGSTLRGLAGAVLLASLLFAVLHLMQVGGGLPPAAALLLVLQTTIAAFWWGALVVAGRSIWPAVMLHSVVNAVVAMQAVSDPGMATGIAAYTKMLLLTVPLGVAGVALLARTAKRERRQPTGARAGAP